MERILSEGRDVLGCFRELILQPQSDLPWFRHRLMEENFRIAEERLVLEEGKFYPMMRAVPGKEQAPWSAAELQFGRYLLREKDPVLHRLLLREKELREKILEQLAGQESPAAAQRRSEIEEERLLIKEALDNYEGF